MGEEGISKGSREPNPRPFSEKSHFCLGRVENNPGEGRIRNGWERRFQSQTDIDVNPGSTTYWLTMWSWRPTSSPRSHFPCLEKGSNKIHSLVYNPRIVVIKWDPMLTKWWGEFIFAPSTNQKEDINAWWQAWINLFFHSSEIIQVPTPCQALCSSQCNWEQDGNQIAMLPAFIMPHNIK